MASPAQIEANRRNALNSTGPKSPEGKEASRRNALKHGLAAETLVMSGEEAEAVAARVAAWSPSLNPRGEYDAWLVEEMVVHSLRVDRCRAQETTLRTGQADRAALCWDEDREAEAEALGGKLKRSPSIVSRQLRRSKQGCAWLIARWEGLGRALEGKGDWDATQKQLAMDLLGTPKELRDGVSPLDGDRRALVAEQVGRLEALRAGAMEELDAHERAAAEVGLGAEAEKAVKLTRRYESACLRRMEWARKQIGKGRPAAGAEPREVASPTPKPARTLAASIRPAEAPHAIRPPSPPPAPSPEPIASVPGENRRARRARLARARRA